MKYLRRFNESNLDIIEEIKDRTMDLQDEGFSVNVYKNNAGYVVQIYHKDYFTISDIISDHLEHLVNFMKSNGYDLKYGNMFRTNQNGCGQEVFFYLGSSWDDEIKEGHTNEDKDDVYTVMDICIDLQDQNFIIVPPHDGFFSKSIVIHKKNMGSSGDEVFRYIEVKETVDRIKEFLGNELHSIYVNKGKAWFKFEHTNMKGYIKAIKITWGK